MDLCPIHNQPFKLVPAGTSKNTGKPYSAFMACPERGCREKPAQQGGWPAVREQVAHKVAPEKAVMTKEDWERKEQRTDNKILLQVAFKAAIEVCTAGKSTIGEVYDNTLKFHTWLLAQTQPQKPVSVPPVAPTTAYNPADLVAEANAALDDAMEIDGSEIHF